MDASAGSQPAPSIPPHPGTVLRQLLEHYGISQAKLAKHIGVAPSLLNMVVRGHRGITPNLAHLLALAFRTTPEFWLLKQVAWDLHHAKPITQVVTPLPEIDERKVNQRPQAERALYPGRSLARQLPTGRPADRLAGECGRPTVGSAG